MMQELFKEDLDAIKENCVYLGDSPNDEPFFKEFSNSIGVANIKEFLGKMKYMPKYITKNPGRLWIRRSYHSHSKLSIKSFISPEKSVEKLKNSPLTG